MTFQDALVSLSVAVVAGALIGAEREQAHVKRAGEEFGGVRTFPLLAIAGTLGAFLAATLGAWIIGALLAAIVVPLAISQLRAKGENVGVTSEIAAILTFGLGVLSGARDVLPDETRFLLVLAIAALTMTLLALKQPLHGFVARVSSDDVYATVKFVLLAVVVIPLLPDRTMGPLDVLNPRKIGLMVALVATVSFAGYVIARTMGARRGLLLTGIVGGLVSSTAVTLALSARAKEEPALARACALGIVAACSTMFARVLFLVGVLDASLLGAVALPLGAMTLVSFTLAALAYRNERQNATAEVPLHNPFELKQAFLFGLLYGAILLAAKAASLYLGTGGIYASAIVAGLTDVDAITISLTQLHGSGTAASIVASGIVLASITNTLVKLLLSRVLGGAELGKRVALVLGFAIVAGVAGAIVHRLL